jgi:hypothetical protein
MWANRTGVAYGENVSTDRQLAELRELIERRFHETRAEIRLEFLKLETQRVRRENDFMKWLMLTLSWATAGVTWILVLARHGR